MRVRFVPTARHQLRTIILWLRENRTVGPFRRELGAAVEQLATTPRLGVRYAGRAGVRRFLLRETRYHVYYRIVDDEVRVLAVWHTARGRGPAL